MHKEDGNGSRSNARQPAGQPEGGGASFGEFLADFVREASDLCVIEIVGETRLLITPLALDLVFLALDVAGVLGTDLHLRANLGREAIIFASAHPLWCADDLEQRVVAHL